MARMPDPRLSRQWLARLARFERSGLTVAEFCQREGVSTASYYQWRRKLRGTAPRIDPRFVPVQVEVEEVAAREPDAIEIALPGGAVVKVPPHTPRSTQRWLIQSVVRATAPVADPESAS